MHRKEQPTFWRTFGLRAWMIFLLAAQRLNFSSFNFSEFALQQRSPRMLHMAFRLLPPGWHDYDALADDAMAHNAPQLLGVILRTGYTDREHVAEQALKQGRLARFWQVYRTIAEPEILPDYLYAAQDADDEEAFRALIRAAKPTTFSPALLDRLAHNWEYRRRPELAQQMRAGMPTMKDAER